MNQNNIGVITGMAFGGLGIVKQDGLVVFIPFATVGDAIKYRIVEHKKSYARGEIIEVLEPSPQRIAPLCPYFGVCGGCQLQQANYTSQLEYKRQWVQEALSRQAGIKDITVPPVIASEQQWSYRRRISMTLRPDKDHFKAGYIAVDNQTLIEVAQCPIFTEDNSIFAHVHDIASNLYADEHQAKLTVLKHGDGRFLLHFHFKTMPKNADEVFSKSIPQSLLAGILATSPITTLQYGDIETSFAIDDLHFNYSPKAFVQAHPIQSQNIYKEIAHQASFLNKGNALDLYCGIGVTSLLLASQGFAVTGIESSGSAIQLAKANAKNNNIDRVRFLKEDVAAILKKYLTEKKLNLVLVNPPREGLDTRVVKALLAHPPQTLIYVSCMPPTLARDLKLLCQSTYHLEMVKAYDMFPQTTHVETLVRMKAEGWRLKAEG